MARAIPPNSNAERDRPPFQNPPPLFVQPQEFQLPVDGDEYDEFDDGGGIEVARVPLFTEEQWNRLRKGIVAVHEAEYGQMVENCLDTSARVTGAKRLRREANATQPISLHLVIAVLAASIFILIMLLVATAAR